MKHIELIDKVLPIQPDFELKTVRLFNIDCMLFMKEIPDNYYELAIVDPPYMNVFSIPASNNCSEVKRNYNLKTLNEQPKDEYFIELKRISKNQIVWGVNYYKFYLGCGRIVWDKDNTGVYSDCELAYHSFSNVTRKFKYRWNGMLQQNMKEKESRIHPTQKPRDLYKWILTKYAKPTDKIFDSHGGSFSSACACLDMGFEFDGCEIDKEYFDNAVERLKNNVQDYFEFT